jgi:pyrophosphatase PpaX
MTRLALLFDLDGTLIDSIDLLLRSMTFAFAERSDGPTRAQWIAGIGTPLRTQLAEWSNNDAETDRLVARYREYQNEHLESLTSAYEGVLDTLAWARAQGHASAIVTSKGKIMTGRSLAHVGLADAFDAIVTYEDTSQHKPLADPVLLALDHLGLPPSLALFVGDSPHDMHAGRAANVRTAAATWGPFTREELAPAAPTYWLTAMTDLRPIVTSLAATSPAAHNP